MLRRPRVEHVGRGRRRTTSALVGSEGEEGHCPIIAEVLDQVPATSGPSAPVDAWARFRTVVTRTKRHVIQGASHDILTHSDTAVGRFAATKSEPVVAPEASDDRQRAHRLRRACSPWPCSWPARSSPGGSNFAADYVNDELSSQNISFPEAAVLQEEGRADLVKFAGHDVNTGAEAEAYASFINGHLQGIADGATYADLGAPETAAKRRGHRRQGRRRQRGDDHGSPGQGRRHHRSAQHPLQG